MTNKELNNLRIQSMTQALAQKKADKRRDAAYNELYKNTKGRPTVSQYLQYADAKEISYQNSKFTPTKLRVDIINTNKCK